MAEYRTIKMSFWNDPYIESLSVKEKLLYLYLFTSSHTNNLGMLEISIKKIGFETSMSESDIKGILIKLGNDKKIIHDISTGEILIKNFIKNQSFTSPKIVLGLVKLIGYVQSNIIVNTLCITYKDIFNGIYTPSIPHTYPIDTPSIPIGEKEREDEYEEKNIYCENLPAIDCETSSQETQQKSYMTKKKKVLMGEKLTQFESLWEAFGDKRGKAEAADEFLRVIQFAKFEAVLQGAKTYAQERIAIKARNGTPKMLQGWLSDRRWEDLVDEKPDYKLIVQKFNEATHGVLPIAETVIEGSYTQKNVDQLCKVISSRMQEGQDMYMNLGKYFSRVAQSENFNGGNGRPAINFDMAVKLETFSSILNSREV